MAAVQRYAEAGASEADIVAALKITEEQLKDPVASSKLRETVAHGNALARVELLATIHVRGRESLPGAGSVNALALRARNLLDWDKQAVTQDPAPDLASAKASLRVTLERLARVRSEELGRDVHPAEILFEGVVPDDPKKIH